MSLFLLVEASDLTIQRYPEGSYVRGKRVLGTPVPVQIRANLQPVKPHILQQMPESDRTSKWCRIFTESLVRTKKEGVGGHDADRFYWQGDLYEVRSTKFWDTGNIRHYDCLAVRVELTPDEVEL